MKIGASAAVADLANNVTELMHGCMLVEKKDLRWTTSWTKSKPKRLYSTLMLLLQAVVATANMFYIHLGRKGKRSRVSCLFDVSKKSHILKAPLLFASRQFF